MRLYAESSAVLAWLLGEPTAPSARAALVGARLVVTSHLTLVECDRVMIRALTGGHLSETARADRHAALARAAATWTLVGLTEEVVERARIPFPVEPVRTLDALHLATALLARSALSGLAFLSLDDRIRANARALGFDVLPD